MIEQVIVPCESGEYDWRANAVRLNPGEPWHIFLSWGDEDRHLSPMEASRPPTHVVLEPEPLLAKLVVLFGRPWSRVLDDPRAVIDVQKRMLDNLTGTFLEDVARSSLAQIQEWVGEMNTVSEGEYIRAITTGENPLCLRN